MKPHINFEDFAKLDLRVGTVIDCVEKEESDKLLRLTVDFGEEGTRKNGANQSTFEICYGGIRPRQFHL